MSILILESEELLPNLATICPFSFRSFFFCLFISFSNQLVWCACFPPPPRVHCGSFFLFFAHAICFLRTLSFSFSLVDVTRIQGDLSRPFPPAPLRYVTSFLSRETSARSSHVDSHRIGPTHAAMRSQQLIPVYFLFLEVNSSPTYVGFEPQNQLL